MLPKLDYAQNVFIEITNLIHGGNGWELGSCLWSPIMSKGAFPSRSWKIMENIRAGDFIIHLVKTNNEYRWYGVSLADSNLIQTNLTPPNPGEWSNMRPYQRINLRNFIRLDNPIPTTEIFFRFNNELRLILEQNGSQFYVKYGQQLRMAQRYICPCPLRLYGIFDNLSSQILFTPIFASNSTIPTVNEPGYVDYNPPGRIPTVVSRIIRDTELSRNIKKEFDWCCQICGNRISLPNNNFYAEAHHLKPLGGRHQGLDIRNNIIVLCPTHHTEFDYGSITIDPDQLIIQHIDTGNLFHRGRLVYERSETLDFLGYHHSYIFNRI